MDKVRIDKWLWAARFYRTRGLAKKAIEGGKIHVDGQRVKPSKDITLGQSIVLRQDWDEKTVVVEALS
ncbi:MAG TPA: RNA-binding protein, partial [Porticoccaceae bacterium]|nr:RNA-binding protein [Porticoccaceae bacterium]